MVVLGERQADPVRRNLCIGLGLGLGAALAGPKVWAAWKWLNEKPEPRQQESPKIDTAKSKNRVKDEDFQKFRDMFEKGPMSYEDAVAYIQERTGMKEIRKHNFNLPDPLGLTKAKEFYLFQVSFFTTDEDIKKVLGMDKFMCPESNGVLYQTHNHGNDGRIMALADYILTRREPSSIINAISILAHWVCDNIELDIPSITSSSIQLPSRGLATSEQWRKSHGIGISNSFNNGIDIIKKGGVCYDFSNILTDLQNSVGIPSRTINLVRHGIVHVAGQPTFSTFAHSLVQTSIEPGVYYYGDPIPAFNRTGGITYDPYAFTSLKELIERMKIDGLHLYYLGITGALTEHQIPSELRETLLRTPFNFITSGFIERYQQFLELELRVQRNPEKRHLIYSQNKPETESQTKITF
ncbi:hypothetical protein HY570_01125 [Candidatus Micrarchaeota archaeon]|nr:hypothetical protein [Candidatus Micrarchaeota archaeon]